MTKYARILHGKVVEIFIPVVGFSLSECLYASVAEQFVEVPNDVTYGWTLTSGKWSAPAIVEPVAPVESGNLSPTPPEFLLLLTLQERVAIRAAGPTDLVIEDLLRMLDDPRVTFIDLTNPSVIEALTYLTTTEPPLLTAKRAARVLAGLSVAA